MANEFKIKNGYLSEGNSQITGSLNVSAGITGSLFGTSSYAIQALSASYVQTVQTASYVLSASYAVTASYVQNAQSASYVLSASYARTASYVQTAQTASYVLHAVSASYATTASYATYAANGGVTSLIAGTGISLFPSIGKGDVTISSLNAVYNTMTGSYGSFYDTGSVLATSTTNIYSMSLSTTDISNGVFVSASSGDVTRVKFTNAGVYDIQFSAQFSNTDNATQDAVVWIRKNGTDISDSAGTVGIPPFKAGSNGQALASWNYFLNVSANDYIQLCWHVEQANVITLETIPAGVSPTHPRTPSLILTANRVDTFLSNTGSFSGSFTGTLTGTSSYASQALSSSYTVSASYALNALSASYAAQALSASYATQAGNASTINISVFGSDVESYLLMSNVAGTTGVAIGGDGDLRYNSSTNKLSVGSVSATSLTGSLLGTASYATQALSSSYSVTASYYGGSVTSASYALTASYVQNAQSASYVQNAQTASYVQNAQTASYVLSASYATTSSYVQNAQSASYVLNAVSSSYALSASYARTASYVQNAQSASYVLNAVSSSFASTASYVQNAQTASYVLNAISASYALNSTTAQTASYVQNAQTASYVLNAVSASFATTASYVQNAQTASYVLSASYATTSSYVQNAQSASYILNAVSSSYALSASYARTASYVQNAQSASYVLNAVSSSFASTASYLNTLNQNLTLNGNFTVNGTASYTYITASQLDVGTNFISVNVGEPAERFGGLIVYDSGSLSHLATASLAWDSLNNHWVYQNASGSTYSGGMLLAGPRNTGSLGDEQSLTRWFVARSDGGDHLNNTQIFSSGSIHIVTGSLTVTAGTTGSLLGTASYASQALSSSYSVTSSYVQNAQSASYVLQAVSASFATQALSASFATTASYVQTAQTASYVQNAQTASYVLNAVSASYVTQALSSSFASTASYVNTLNQNVLITGSLTVGASSAGASENTLTLGARDTSNEGGQIGFNAPGGTYTSASFIDNWQNKARILKGNNTTSTGLIAQWDIHTTQLQLPAYVNASSFVGTATANLAVDSGGNVITVSTSGAPVFPYVGNAVITGSLTTTGIIYAQPNGGMYFQGGDDAALYDINISNHMGIYGVQDSTVASIKLGSGGGIISGKSSNIGIGTINPTSASFQVNGNVWANSFTGSLLGTASYATTTISASYALNATTANTASYVLQAVSASFATLSQTANTASYVQTAQTASYVLNAVSSSYALSASFAVSSSRAVSASFATTASYYGGSVTSASYALTASYVNPLVQNVIVTGSLDVSGSFIAYDEDNVKAIQANVSKRALFDTSAVTSVNWSGRGLYSPSSILAVDWSDDTILNSNTYQRDYKSRPIQNLVSNNLNNPYTSYLGDLIEVDGNSTFIDSSVSDGMLVYLNTDATWYPVTQNSTTAIKMLGIAFNVDTPSNTGYILLEGHVVITDTGTSGPHVTGADHGLPIYIEDSTTTGQMSTTLPTTAGGNNVIRVLGHCYWQNTGTTSQWMMKFRPSNDWITI
jgi:hypothetical protein